MTTDLSTHALDLATVLQGIAGTEKEIGKQYGSWTPQNTSQQNVLKLLGRWQEELPRLTDMDIKAHVSWDAAHLIGTVTVDTTLDKLVQWVNGIADRKTIFSVNHKNYPGFVIRGNGFTARETKQGILAWVLTKSGDTLWLFLPARDLAPFHGIEMVEMASNLMLGWQSFAFVSYEEAHIPMLDFRLKPDIGFLAGLSISGSKGKCSVLRASQDFRMRMDQEGARVVVQTNIYSQIIGAAFRDLPRVLIFNRPFYGWYSQKDLNIPMAVFYAGYASWRKPSGSLATL